MRAAVLAVAVVTGAWFAVGALQARDTRRATAILASGGRLSPASARHTSSLLDGAGFLNPDRQVDVLRAQLDLGQGHELAARSILKRVVVSEPDNLQAWVWLARASVGDLKDFYAAAYRIRQLVPPARPLR